MSEDFLQFLNSDRIAGQLKGAVIKDIKFKALKNRKNILKVTITTNLPFKPFITLGDLFERADIRHYCTGYEEYGLKTLIFLIKMKNTGKQWI